MLIIKRFLYQLDFVTPGMSPRKLRNRKQIRHMRNRRKNPLTRPQHGQRLYWREENFGSLLALFFNANLDTDSFLPLLGFSERHS